MIEHKRNQQYRHEPLLIKRSVTKLVVELIQLMYLSIPVMNALSEGVGCKAHSVMQTSLVQIQMKEEQQHLILQH